MFFLTQVNAQSALKQVEKFLQHSEHIKSIWPGFIDKFHHSIYRSNGQVFLALDEPQLPGWEQVKVVNNTPIWVKKDKKFAELSGLFFIERPLNNGIEIDGAFNNEHAIYSLFHESFHSFQNTLNRPETLWKNINISEYIITIKRKEFSILHKLLKQELNDVNEMNKNIVLYVSIRSYRESLMKQNAIELERAMEWQEGVAAYMEYRIKDIMKSSSFGTLLNDFGLKVTNQENSNQLEQFMRWDAYYYGAALCFLLEKSLPEWQAHIEQGKTPFELLNNIFTTIELQDKDIEQLLSVNKKRTKKLSDKTVEQEAFTQHKSWKNTLQLKLPKTGITFQPQKLTSFNNGILAHQVMKLQTNSDHLTISGRSGYMFMPSNDQEEFGTYYFKIRKLPKKPKTCEVISESQWLCKSGTKFKISGVKIKLKKETNVNITDDAIQFL